MVGEWEHWLLRSSNLQQQQQLPTCNACTLQRQKAGCHFCRCIDVQCVSFSLSRRVMVLVCRAGPPLIWLWKKALLRRALSGELLTSPASCYRGYCQLRTGAVRLAIEPLLASDVDLGVQPQCQCIQQCGLATATGTLHRSAQKLNGPC